MSPERSFGLKATFLGTGTSVGVPALTCDCDVCRSTDPRNHRLRPSMLLEWDGTAILIDTSTDLRQQGLRHGIKRVDAVLYTHGHADHILGMDELRLYNWRQGGPIPICGSESTITDIRKTFWYAFEDGQEGGGKPAVRPVAIDGPFELLGRRVVPVPLLHGRMSIFGYRIGDFAYLTDVSSIPDSSYALLQDLEILVLNALRHKTHSTHLSLAEAVREATTIGAARTYLTHMGHDISHGATEAELPENVELAYDGLVLFSGRQPG